MEGPHRNRHRRIVAEHRKAATFAWPFGAMWRSRVQRISVAVAALLAAGAAYADSVPDRPPQYVVISFDGAREIEQWHRSRNLARQAGANFTYFLSCVYLVPEDRRADYDPPGRKAGSSNVGFAPSREDVAVRLRQIWAVRMEGHEIASHGCGHFDGGGWSRKEWGAEFGQFSDILRDAWTANDIPYEPSGWKRFVDREIVGFRAPYLAVGPGLVPALADGGFQYDASGVSRGPQPSGMQDGVTLHSLPMIPEGPKARRIIAMDYNLYVRHSGALERPSEAATFEARTYDAFRAAFEEQYQGERIPLQIGFHFRLMNDGAYWRALERFAIETCRMAEVRCVTYRALTEQVAAPTKATAARAHHATD